MKVLQLTFVFSFLAVDGFRQYFYHIDSTRSKWLYFFEPRTNLGRVRSDDCPSESRLALPLNSKENDFMTSRYSGLFYIDCNDETTEGVWKREDGTAVIFMNWDYGQPGGGRGEQCAVMTGSGWHDYPCSISESIGYICEMTHTVDSSSGVLFRCADVFCPKSGGTVLQVESKRFCALLCFRNPRCSGFQFNGTSEECLLADQDEMQFYETEPEIDEFITCCRRKMTWSLTECK